MAIEQPAWLGSGNGLPPQQTWAFTTDAPLADVQFARETGETLAADVLGGLYRLDPNGRITCMTRGFKHLRHLAWSDTATFGGAVLGEEMLCRFDQKLQITWTRPLPGTIHAVAMDAYGNYLAAALETGHNMVIGADQQIVCEFSSIRPLHFLRFFVMDRDLMGAANYGVLQRQHFNGEPAWAEKVLNTVGDLAVTGNGKLRTWRVSVMGCRFTMVKATTTPPTS